MKQPAKDAQAIQVLDRKTKLTFFETVYGGGVLAWTAHTPLGRFLTRVFLSGKFLSRMMGLFYSSFLSIPKIKKFIDLFQVDMTEYEACSYSSFNEFFVRRFKFGARAFDSNSNVLAAPAEGRYFAFDSVHAGLKFPVKGQFLSSREILENSKYAEMFQGGPLLIARLCPVDYHRFHFPCDGKVIDHYRLSGRLFSVNPIWLAVEPRTFALNERQVTILETKDFGRIAYVEVGALGVGKINQVSGTDREGHRFTRGDEKGHFLFGGSTVMVFGEIGKWTPAQDLLDSSERGLEVFLRLGEACAQSAR